MHMQIACFLKSRVWTSFVLSCATAILCCTSGWADEPPGPSVSKSLLAAIRKVSPKATILQANQVDVKSCAPVPKSPGLVPADLNGDGLEDIAVLLDRKSTRLNSSHVSRSYAVFCLKKQKATVSATSLLTQSPISSNPKTHSSMS